MAKFEQKYIKTKVKATFGDIEIYNPEFIDGAYEKLSQMIKENTEKIQLENNNEDTQINNATNIMRLMLSKLTNIENNWEDIDDYELERMCDLSDGDFKLAVTCLIDIMIGIGKDIRIQSTRQLDMLSSKLDELSEVLKFNAKMENKLNELGLDRNKLNNLLQGDEKTTKEFQQKLLENEKASKKRKPKKTK